MALRDRFAAAALAGIMANPASGHLDDDTIAESCYAAADALLRARMSGTSSDKLVANLRRWADGDFADDLISPAEILMKAANEIERLKDEIFRKVAENTPSVYRPEPKQRIAT